MSARYRERMECEPTPAHAVGGAPEALLDQPLYGFSEVDRILKLAPGTSRRWIDGYRRGGKQYDPVVRESHTGDEAVTWGEYVETRLLSEYRGAGVPIIRLRPAVLRLREQFGTRYPLAHAKPWLEPEGRDLVWVAQDDARLDRELCMVIYVGSGQLALAPAVERFTDAATFTEDGGAKVATSFDVPGFDGVSINPLLRFGSPAINGVRTRVLAEFLDAGDTAGDVADAYGLTPHQVETASRYEAHLSLR